MKPPVRTIEPPTSMPVSVEEVKSIAGVDHAEHDLLIPRYIRAAREVAEHATGRLYGPRVLEVVMDAWPAAEIELDAAPVTEVVSVEWANDAGEWQSVGADGWVLDAADPSRPAWLLPSASAPTWPEGVAEAVNAVRIRFRAGSPVETMPDSVALWVLQAAATIYASPELIATGAVARLDQTLYPALLDPWRTYR